MQDKVNDLFYPNFGLVDVDGITVFFDEDKDERVIPVVHALKSALDHRGFPNVLLAVKEHEATLIVQLKPFCTDWNGRLRGLIEGLVGKLSDLIVTDYWTTEFLE